MVKQLSRFHPLSMLAFIVSVLAVVLVINDPVMLLVSLFISLIYIFAFGGRTVFLRYILMTCICAAGVMLINPLVSHRGITVLFYLPDGNPLTLESVIYGAAAAVLISSTVNWFYTVSICFNSERIVYLFGRLSPRLALLLSLTLGFVPKLQRRLADIRAARSVVKRDFTQGRPGERMKNAACIMSSLIGGALENSVDTADSMTSRGYASRRRTSFSPFRLYARDVVFILTQLSCLAGIMYFYFSGKLDFSYYPTFSAAELTLSCAAAYILYAFMCSLPLIVCMKESIKWKFIRSGI